MDSLVCTCKPQLIGARASQFHSPRRVAPGAEAGAKMGKGCSAEQHMQVGIRFSP